MNVCDFKISVKNITFFALLFTLLQYFTYKILINWQSREIIYYVVNNKSSLSNIKGIQSDHLQSYANNINYKLKTFSCIIDQNIISIAFLNDDYCDCKDGTDEPSTSACINSRFYCDSQIPLYKDKYKLSFVFSSQVNDGICDCCDGSDEWQNQINCPNICQQLQKQSYLQLKDFKSGRILKHLYVEKAKKSHIGPKTYGMENEFYHLSQKCLTYRQNNYKYQICLFQGGSFQVHLSNGQRFNLGNKFKWHLANKNITSTLLMYDGDPLNCPSIIEADSIDGIAIRGRKCLISFQCSSMDKILSIHEIKPCSYNIIIQTPSAC